MLTLLCVFPMSIEQCPWVGLGNILILELDVSTKLNTLGSTLIFIPTGLWSEIFWSYSANPPTKKSSIFIVLITELGW